MLGRRTSRGLRYISGRILNRELCNLMVLCLKVLQPNPMLVFYFVRCLLAGICASAEVLLFMNYMQGCIFYKQTTTFKDHFTEREPIFRSVTN